MSLVILSILYFAISYAAYKHNEGLKKQGFTGIPTIQCFNPIKWASVFQGYLFKLLIPKHVFEQYVLRFYDEECRRDCMLAGKCKSCGCDAIAKGWSAGEKCSLGNWVPIIWSRRKYKEYREKYPVKIEIKYGDFQGN